MRLDGLERHRHGSSLLHRLDARIKLIAALALIVAVLAMPIAAWRSYGAAGLLLAFVIGLSGIPPREIGRRWLGLFVVVAFLVAMIAYGHPERSRLGLPAVAASILIKNGLALLTMIVLAGTTPFPRLLMGMRRLGVPVVLVATLQSMERFRHVLVDEVDRMATARKARYVQPPRHAVVEPARRIDRHAVPADSGARRAGARRDGRPGLDRDDPQPGRLRSGRTMSVAEPREPELSPPSPEVEAVRVRGLEYRYPDGKEALRGVDLAISPGESVALVGPNGAGKSTLLLHLNGLLPGKSRGAIGHGHAIGGGGDGARRRPSVWIDGLEVNDRNAPEVRRRVGLVFQDPDDQLFCNTVIEDVAFGPLNLGMSPAEARRIAEECLERVDLASEAARPPHHLSFGERKRACLAGVLACRPSVLALDEPTANLDPRGRRRFIRLVQGLGCTMLIATHDLEMVLDVCGRVVLLDGGRVVADGPSRDVLADAEGIERHGLERPLSLGRSSQ